MVTQMGAVQIGSAWTLDQKIWVQVPALAFLAVSSSQVIKPPRDPHLDGLTWLTWQLTHSPEESCGEPNCCARPTERNWALLRDREGRGGREPAEEGGARSI